MTQEPELSHDAKAIIQHMQDAKAALTNLRERMASVPAIQYSSGEAIRTLDTAFLWANQACFLEATLPAERRAAVEQALASGNVITFPEQVASVNGVQ